MTDPIADFRKLVLRHLHEVRQTLGLEALTDSNHRFADVLDSMGTVELIGRIADECGATVEEIERAANHRYDTVDALAKALADTGFRSGPRARTDESSPRRSDPTAPIFLSGAALALPATAQSAAELDKLLARALGWFEARTGIKRRHIWHDDDPLEAAAQAGRQCVERASFPISRIGALLVVSEAPPSPVGTAAALHHLLGLAQDVPAVEIGNACTGFLTALWIARQMLTSMEAILVIAIEAPSFHLKIAPGPDAETAALFSDGAAACLLSLSPIGTPVTSIGRVVLGTNGSARDLLHVTKRPSGDFQVAMDGPALAARAVRTMADAVRQMATLHGLSIEDLTAVVAHGGNGRMPASRPEP